MRGISSHTINDSVYLETDAGGQNYIIHHKATIY